MLQTTVRQSRSNWYWHRTLLLCSVS